MFMSSTLPLLQNYIKKWNKIVHELVCVMQIMHPISWKHLRCETIEGSHISFANIFFGFWELKTAFVNQKQNSIIPQQGTLCFESGMQSIGHYSSSIVNCNIHCREQIVGERKAEYERLSFQAAEAEVAEKMEADRLRKQEIKYRMELQVCVTLHLWFCKVPIGYISWPKVSYHITS